MPEDEVQPGGPDEEQHHADNHIEGPAGSHVDQRQQRPEEEKAGAEVLHKDHQQDREPPDADERREIAERWKRDSEHTMGADREHFSDVHQVGGKEGYQQHLGELRRLKVDGPHGEP